MILVTQNQLLWYQWQWNYLATSNYQMATPSPTQPVSYHCQKGRPMYCPLETQLAPESFFISNERIFGPLYTGCPKKNAILTLTGHRGHQEWTRDKSRVSFAKFRKFPFWWAQKLLIFVRKWLRKMRSKLPTPLEKRHECGSSWRYSFLSPFF